MRIPEGMTEKQVMDTIEAVVWKIAVQFKDTFKAFMGRDDLCQEVRLMCLVALESGHYDPARPLEAYLYQSAKNRTLNMRRDRIMRADTPCKLCHGGVPCRPDGQQCKVYQKWAKRQHTKAGLTCPAPIDKLPETAGTHPDEVVNRAETAEIRRIIDQNLPLELRRPYLMMLDQVPVIRSDRIRVQTAIMEILENAGLMPADLAIHVRPEKRLSASPDAIAVIVEALTAA